MSADFTPEKEDYGVLSPFKMQVLTNFPYIEADFDALTNYQLLCKVVEYLNNVIHNENEVTEQITSLYNAYVSLQNYVNTYFDNLDLTTEVSNKLDEMATDGTLTNLIKEYVDPIYGAYETRINEDIADFKEDTNTDISDFKTSVNTQIGIIDNKVESATSGSPAGVYADATALAAADPDHSKIYVVLDTGYWYYYDTTSSTWTAGGAYQEAVNNNTLDVIDRYLYSSMEIIEGKFVNPNGTFTNNVNFGVTPYIRLDGVSRITFPQLYATNPNGATSCYYDAGKKFLSAVPQESAENDLITDNVPEGAKYVVCTIRLSSASSFFFQSDSILDSNIKTLEYIDGGIQTKNMDISQLDLTTGYYLKTDGTVFANANGRITPFIPCKNFNSVYWTNYFGTDSTIGLCWYDKYQHYISGHANTVGWGGREKAVVPDGACFFRLPFGISDIASINLETAYVLSDVSIGNIEVDKDLFNFNNIKIHNKVLFIGDSLTEGYRTGTVKLKDKSYPSYSAKLGNWTINNAGVSGYTVLDWWNNKRSEINADSYDAIFIYLGTNGGLTDTIDEDTSSGNYETYANTNTGRYCSIIEDCLDKHPYAKIYLVTTTLRPSVPTWPVLSKIAEKYSLPLLNVEDTRFYDLSSVDYHMSAEDMTHYNTAGYWALSQVLMSQCEEYIKDNLDEYKNV